MKRYYKGGSREFFLQWAILQTNLVFFVLADKKRPFFGILHPEKKYVRYFGV